MVLIILIHLYMQKKKLNIKMIESFNEKLCCFEDEFKTRIWNLEEDQQKICKCCGLMFNYVCAKIDSSHIA
jgi:hypothetical protein